MWHRLMCDRCKQPYALYPGYRFFVALDVTLRCCGKPQRLERLEPVSRTWKPCREQVTPRAFYEMTGAPISAD